MSAQAKAQGDIIFDDLFAKAHLGKEGRWFCEAFSVHIACKEGQRRFCRDRFGVPDGLSSVEAKRDKGICLG